jgi:hypothetical protein
MISRQTIKLLSIIFIAVSVALIVWPRAAMTQQDQAAQKKTTDADDR